MSMRATTDYISYSYAAVVAFGGVFGYLKAGTLYLYNSTVNRVQGGAHDTSGAVATHTLRVL
jgi:hypothetical protein